MAIRKNSGDFNRRVAFKKPTISRNNEGSLEATYTVDFTLWAAVSKGKDSRQTEGNGDKLVETKVFDIRDDQKAALIKMDWLISYNGNEYAIYAIEGEDAVISITAKAQNNG